MRAMESMQRRQFIVGSLAVSAGALLPVTIPEWTHARPHARMQARGHKLRVTRRVVHRFRSVAGRYRSLLRLETCRIEPDAIVGVSRPTLAARHQESAAGAAPTLAAHRRWPAAGCPGAAVLVRLLRPVAEPAGTRTDRRVARRNRDGKAA